MPTYPYEINLPDAAGLYRFETSKELDAFLRNERNYWNFVVDLQRSSNLINDLWNKYSQFTQNLDSAISGVANPVFDPGPVLARAFGDSGFPSSTSQKGSVVAEAKARLGPRGAAGCLATLVGSSINANDSVQLQGFLIAADYLGTVNDASSAAVQKGLEGLIDRLSERQSETAALADQLSSQSDRINSAHKRHFKKALQAARSARRKLWGELATQVAEKITEIKETRQAYTEYMSLKAPVTYWKDQSTTHRNNSRIAMAIGLVYATVFVVVMLTWASSTIRSAVADEVKATGQWQSSYIILSIAVVILTVIFWVGRIISRLYLSEQHLSTDASERAVMAEAYLALTNEGKITDAERILVLQALFRASSDGVVRDDGPPDVGVLPMVSRLISAEGSRR